ncbi:MAG: formate/nitrite transporter family protein [Alphaproteobacteria bacterium]|nr:formate/nitrite transporter family protein [Alphaproteobacteria bacterium]
MTTSLSSKTGQQDPSEPRDHMESVNGTPQSGADAGVEAHRRMSAGKTFEVVRRDGEEEMARPATSLAFSGLAAGLAMGFSVLTEAVMNTHLPADAVWAPLIGNMGYTIGFILVIVGGMQLFTENTIIPVATLCKSPTRSNFLRLARIWSLVLAANIVGAVLFAIFVMKTSAVPPSVQEAILGLGRHASDGGFLVTMTKGVGAGFLIAALGWLLAGRQSGEVLLVFIITYVVALAGFSHVVAGTVEMAALVIVGQIGIEAAVFGFILPALIGNILGGTFLFTFLTYGQIREELPEKK